MAATPPPSSVPPARTPIDVRLAQWFAAELILDSRARLVEGGAGGDTRIDLAQVFVDLPVVAWCGRDTSPDERQVVQSICQEPDKKDDESPTRAVRLRGNNRMMSRALIIGGPGSGKSTATTMVSQLLRHEQVCARLDEMPALIQERVREVARGLDELRRRIDIEVCRNVLPLRINLPELSRWMASRDNEDPGQLLWRFLASRATEHAAICGLTLELPAAELKVLAQSHDSILWIFDGLDEVPRSADRDRVVAVIHAAAPRGATQGVVVTTRPQGYEGEFGELDSLVLTEMPPKLALNYGQRLLRAWSGTEDPQLNERLTSLEVEFAKAEVQALVRSPLHATMATLLVAEHGTLPDARHMLFEHYFDTIFRRELGKKGEHGVRLVDKQLLKTLHARVGLVLHTRSQDRAGARPTLSPRELRAILETIFGEDGRSAEEAQAIAERMLRFAADRLVLLLRVTDGGYAFGIRSLQEFFAGVALLDGETAEVKHRIEAIALNPHWSNVLGLMVSGLAVSGTGATTKASALEYTRELCRALNDGTLGGRSAAACVAGSRLAIAMLRETERYGGPWLHDTLWEIALEAAWSPIQIESARYAEMSFYWRPESVSAQWDDELEVHVRLGSLAVSWNGSNRDKWLLRVLKSAAALLEEGKQQPSAGWRLLLLALQREEPRAVRIADAHAPETPEMARRLLEAAFEWWGHTAAPWVTKFASDHAAWLPPGWLASRRPPGRVPWPDSGVLSPWSLDWREDDSPFLRVSLGGDVACVLWTLDVATAIWSRVTLPMVTGSAEWRAWHKLAAFHAQPSKDRLADVLEAVAEPGAWDDSLWPSPPMAWPVRDCLDFVADAAELKSLAASVRAGQLGELEDWRVAEARWLSNPSPSDDEIASWLSARELPWTQSIATSGRIFSLHIARRFGMDGETFLREISRACATLLKDSCYRRRPVAWLQSMLQQELYTDSLGVTGDLVPREIAERAPNKPDVDPYGVLFAVDLLLPDLSGPAADGWYRLLDERGRRGWNRWSSTLEYEWHSTRLTEILMALLTQLSVRPDQWGLVDAIWAVLNSLPTGSLVGLCQPPLPPHAPARVRGSAAALSLLAPDDAAVDVPALLTILVSEEEKFDLRQQLASILARRHNDRARATSLLLHMLDTTSDADEELRDAILAGIFQHLKQSSPPAFSSAESWKEHHLPEPYLSGQAPEVLPPRIINLVELSNIRLFKDTPTVDAPFPIPEPDQGQWIVLVGENGIGKTTLLRALGLALADPTVASRLLDENQPFVRNGGDGRITIELDTGPIEVIVRRDARTEAIVPVGNNKVTRPWVIGYGVRRGNARGEKDRAPEWGPTGELHTLFDRPATLVNAVDWLLDLDRRVLNERRQYGPEPDDGGPRFHAATWQSVERALKALLRVTVIEPEERHVMVTHPEFGRVRLDALSDGYLTTTGWVIDLIARWVQRQEDLGEAVGRDLLRQMTGIVLIDEIDLHLHPRWQMNIIDDVRRLFPRLSFVVTTHNPLTLQGARPGEVFIMRRGDGSGIELTQRDIQPGHDVDRVLFEQFGIVYTFDKDTRMLLQQHRALLERGAAPNDAERVKLESQLAARLGRVGEVLTDERGVEQDPSQPWSDEDRRLLNRFDKGKA